MSNSAHAEVVLGAELNFYTTDYTAQLNRFNPLTGAPVKLASKAFHLDVQFICANGLRLEYRLPEDDQAFAEHPRSSYGGGDRSGWEYDRRQSRKSDWLESLGIIHSDEADLNDARLCQFGAYHNDHCVIGISIAKGSSSDVSDKQVTRICAPSPELVARTTQLLTETFLPIFGPDAQKISMDVVAYISEPKLFLVTRLNG